MRRRTARFAGGATALLLLTLGACSDSDPGGPTTTAASSPTDSSSSSSSSPTEPAEPSVSPASGPSVEADSATINIPDGWKPTDSGLPNTYGGSNDAMPGLQLVTIIDLPLSPSGLSLGELARDAMKALPGAELTRQPDVELDGSPAYRIAGIGQTGAPYEAVGTEDHGSALNMSFDLDGYGPAERRAIVDSVIASFRWKA